MKRNGMIILIALLSVFGRAQDMATTHVLVTDFSDKPIPGAQIQFFNTKNTATIEAFADEAGEFIVDLPAGIYNIRLQSMGKSKDYNIIEIPELGEREVYNNVNIIIQFEEETSFTLTDLHFETAKSVIKPESFNELDELVKYLNQKSKLKIEIAGHTDNAGSDADNLILSQNRAEAVKNYLIKKGINAQRIVAQGYGETKPISDNETEAGRALNRRTEINIIE